LHRLNHRPVRVAGMTYGSDMRHLVNAGSIPTVLFGPGDVRRAHRPDEYVTVAELELVTQTLALAALYHCGYDA
jgi:acetylornithine deacetylase